MPLIPIFQASEEEVYKLQIQQVVALCGNGQLKDGGDCSDELRGFLKKVPSEKLFVYAEKCLTEPFDKSGQVLQDVVNELGRRLDYEVENGRYQGTQKAIGFDGIWRRGDQSALVVEVKTTDVYRINLDTIADYRNRLVVDGEISKTSSILIVVGRQDTGDLEAQVRGSRHAWDVRLISVDALIKLVRLKEEAEDNTVAKIHDLLIPFEYTRVDRIIDIAFTAAKEVSDTIEKESGVAAPESDASEGEISTREATPQVEIEKLRNKIINAIGKQETASLIRKSGALFWSVDDNRRLRVACTVSKRYTRGDSYWYAYHPKWDAFLGEGEKSYFILGCMDRNEAYALPLEWIRKQLPDLYQSIGPDDHYWHINLNEEHGAILFRVPKTKQWVDLKAFKLQL